LSTSFALAAFVKLRWVSFNFQFFYLVRFARLGLMVEFH